MQSAGGSRSHPAVCACRERAPMNPPLLAIRYPLRKYPMILALP